MAIELGLYSFLRGILAPSWPLAVVHIGVVVP